MFTFRGMWLDWPPYILRPTTRLAYWTGMRRSEFWMNTMSTTMASMPMTIRMAPHQGMENWPVTPSRLLRMPI